MKFKVGDKVRTLSEWDGAERLKFPIGTICMIVEADDSDRDLPYHITDNAGYWWYPEGALELVVERPYEQGLIDMWNALSYNYSATHSERMKIFGNDNFGDILLLNPEEIISKYRVYTDRVTVNDVVKLQDDTLALVIDESSDDTVFVLTENRCMEEWPRNELKRTGKKIDVNAIVNQMKS